MSMFTDLEKHLRAEVESSGERAFLERVKNLMEKHAAPERLHAYLESHSLKGVYQDAAAWSEWKLKSIAHLARCLRKMGVCPTIDLRYSPWSSVDPGSVAVIFVGVRHVSIPEVATDLRQRAVGARDMEALVELSNFLQGAARTECRLEVQLVSRDRSLGDAMSQLRKLRSRREVGVVVVLGSAVSNQMTEAMARVILDDQRVDRIPARFRWSFRSADSVLSERKAYPPSEEGIGVPDVRKTDFPRTRDDKVLELVKKAKQGPFPDCGILMLDSRVRPLLVLAAGHGGCGTKACIRALTNQERISQKLEQSRDQQSAVIGAHRVFEVISVNRTAPNADNGVDDMDVKSCHFGFDHELIKWP